MHPELKALLDEHTSPSHATKDHIHGLARPILALCSKAQMQAAQYWGLLLDAKHAPHDGKIDAKLNGIKSALGAMDDAVKVFRESGDKLTDAMSALDRYMTDAKTDFARYYEASNG